MKYYFVSQEFVSQNDGYSVGPNTFRAFLIERGGHKDKYVVAEQALLDFPDLFAELQLDYVNLDPIDFAIDYTPPATNGKGIVIPEKYQWIFPVRVGGFTLELKDKDGVKYAEESFLGWTAFVREIRKPENVQYRATILPVWNYGLTEAERINL